MGKHTRTNNIGLQIDHNSPGHVLARARLLEEGAERVIPQHAGARHIVIWHCAIGLDAVLHAVELPAGVADLDTSLAHVDGDALTLL